MADLRLLHLSDFHLFCPEVSFAEVLDRRLIGYLRWRLSRHRHHDESLLESVRKLIADLRPDQVLVTGDLTHLGLPREFARAKQWLARLGTPAQVMVVPGNHDAYRWGAWEETFGLWEPYLRGEEDREARRLEDLFPAVRRLGRVALIGLSTACPNRPPWAVGRVGRAQLERLRRVLKKTRGLFRLVLLHHPPLPGVVGRRKGLLDLEELVAVLAEAGVEGLLFGHTHRRHAFSVGAIEVRGAPSITCVSRHPSKRAACYLLEVGARLSSRTYSWDEAKRAFVAEPEERVLARG